ncbi:MAG: alanine--tRNA ligase [Patescibacteria group bacterium]|nr:alanine--tRNA ligase [Patescibacteria group bacterium]
MMDSEEIRKKFLDFFEKRGHKIISSSSLIPDDPTSLFTSAGMQQLVLYLGGKRDPIKDFGSRHLVSCQKCFRTDDIEEVGDETHQTFFEMLGNWSVGEDPKSGYFKTGAIKLTLDFFCDVLKLNKNRFWVTIFKGEKDILRDEESFLIWQKQGIPKKRIKEFGMAENFWGPVGDSGPCGPCSEIHYNRGEKFGCGRKNCGPNCPNCQRFIELWNLVFMEYNKVKSEIRNPKSENYIYKKLPQRNIDTGVGFERLVAVLQNKNSAYESDLFWPAIQEIEKKSNKKYLDNKKKFRIIADHLRAVCFLIAEGVMPSNLDRGYVLRRLLRRIQRVEKFLELKENWEVSSVKWLIKKYQKIYPELIGKENDILIVIQKEKERFLRVLSEGTRYFEKLISEKIQKRKAKVIEGKEAFFLYESYGFPLEMIQELSQEKDFEVDKIGFEKSFKKHQEISRVGAERKFGGIGVEKLKIKSEKLKVTKLHTVTHLLHQALRESLGEQVKQMGSDITPERLRFDFSFERKMTSEEIKKIEDLVNQKIKEDLEVKKEEMPLKEALKSGALAFFKEKYPEKVSVFTIFNPKTKEVFSKEICAGPHIKRTSEIGRFKIKKEESSGAGIRRIRAILVSH